jgi:hypothetical protein
MKFISKIGPFLKKKKRKILKKLRFDVVTLDLKTLFKKNASTIE